MKHAFYTFICLTLLFTQGFANEESMTMKYDVFADIYVVTSKVLVDGESVSFLEVQNAFPSSELIRYSEYEDQCTVYFRQLEAYTGYWTLNQTCDEAVARHWVVYRTPILVGLASAILLWFGALFIRN